MTTFRDFFHDRLEKGGFTTEDSLASFLPLARQAIAAHTAGLVAPLQGIEDLRVEGVQIFFDEAACRPASLQPGKTRTLEKSAARALEVVGESRVSVEVTTGHESVVSLEIGVSGQEITRPVYLPGYISWEHEIGHHDPMTDTYCLGLILASLVCGLDLSDPKQLGVFVNHRHNLFDLAPNLHPVLAKAVNRMTELDRHRRPQDLSALLHTLENCRDQDIDFEYALARSPGFRETDISGKSRTVLATLQQRLLEISRRNRLLHFRQTMQTVNLTVASVPLAFDINSIRPEQILTWDKDLADSLGLGKSFSLNKHLRFEEAVYLPGVLDHIRSEAHRDQLEFGFAQLRLVLCFLRWSNLKEKPPERFESPLILLPVRLVKKKGVRDTYSLESLATDAEVNPVLRYYFKQLYDVSLPETLDLTSTSVDEFHQFLASKVQASEPAVSVTKIDRPRIHLIHAAARCRLDQYIQRTRYPAGVGLEGVPQQDRELCSLGEPDSANPFAWEYDLCSVTLGNFRYRKMSLVRDYAALLENGPNNPAFNAIFSLEPRAVGPPSSGPLSLEDRYPVLTCDPTQATAIARARSGKSYIIQGPPGTGKSQTIANLMADYIARGQRVLFVCEKRAAIDVVYHRLRQKGLHVLCSLIHDSQEDKKEFILDLKQTYESFLERAGKEDAPTGRRRQELFQAVRRELKPLQHFNETMRSNPNGVAVPLRRVLDRLAGLRHELPELSALETERIPIYAQWCEHRDRLERMSAVLKETQPDLVYSRHPLKYLTTRLAAAERPLEKVAVALQNARKLLETLEEGFREVGLQAEECDSREKALHVVAYANQVHYLAEKNLLSLLEAGSDSAKKFSALESEFREKVKQLEKARLATAGWRQKLSPAELSIALEQARAFQQSFFSFLNPAWWRLGATLRRCYDFRSHRIKPTWTQVLESLEREYQAVSVLEDLQGKAQHAFVFGETLQAFVEKVHELEKAGTQLPVEVQNLQRRLLADRTANAAVIRLAKLRPNLEHLDRELAGFLDDCNGRSFAELKEAFNLIDKSLDDLPEFLACLTEAAGLPRELLGVLRRLPLTTAGLEGVMARRTWDDVCQADRALARFTGRVRSRHVHELEKFLDELHEVNAAILCEEVRRRFLDHVRIAGLPHARLAPEQKEFKTAYNRGRRELEHEFGKTMRYRSIRDLVAGDSGLVIQDLKPVWLMSPLSVSDTLPLDATHFDVVIFDEASQVTLEAAVPSLFRAAQVIVVGDEMQLPPTNFFSAKRHEDKETLVIEDLASGEFLEYDLESNSFLAHAARVLPSTMLGWHYRSRSESLISYSNVAFYHGQLLTVPDKTLPASDWAEIRVSSPDEGTANVDRLLERAASFHFIEDGVYHDRRNAAEADYIANLVREILSREMGLSIGIIAFSETQQAEIQSALTRLGEADNEFRDRLEAEFEREENGQFVGLLVKNLENIQGDERDIIILSVCYGRSPSGKMLMNFGPINQSGGEKRLNVAFSRAKQHMALVSSIHQHEITNDYNDGARCLKNYLRYMEAASIGDLDTTKQALREMLVRPEGAAPLEEISAEVVIEQLAAELRARGFEIDLEVGQSSFRCDVAVRRRGDRAYRAGILVDTQAYYRQSDILERDVMRPKLLETFGWRIKHVLAKDWYLNPTAVLDELTHFVDEEPLDRS
jgi:hypothetical protein